MRVVPNFWTSIVGDLADAADANLLAILFSIELNCSSLSYCICSLAFRMNRSCSWGLEVLVDHVSYRLILSIENEYGRCLWKSFSYIILLLHIKNMNNDFCLIVLIIDLVPMICCQVRCFRRPRTMDRRNQQMPTTVFQFDGIFIGWDERLIHSSHVVKVNKTIPKKRTREHSMVNVWYVC